jgi:hypothetical protein
MHVTGGEGIRISEYTGVGRVTEFKYSAEIGNAFRGNNPIKYLNNFGNVSFFFLFRSISNIKVKLFLHLINKSPCHEGV